MARGRRGRRRAASTQAWTRPVRRRAPHLGPSTLSARAALLLEAGRRLRSGEPLDLLAYVSGLLAATDPRGRDPLSGDDPDEPGRPALVRTLGAVPGRETTALLLCIAALDAGAAGVDAGRALAGRDDPVPGWLQRLADTRVHRTLEAADASGDGESVLVGVTVPGGHELTALVHVDHNAGSVAADGFVVDRPLSELAARFEEAGDLDLSVREIPGDAARARVEEAIGHGAMMFPPFVTESWPSARPLVEWIVRMLPEGGEGYARPEWPQEARDALADRFFASPHGAPLDDAGGRDLLDSILWYGADYGPGDPMRWSARAAEILLLDWIPRKIVAESAHLAPAPELLAAFVRFCDAERGAPAARTAETLDAIAAMADEYREAVTSPRLQGPMALLAAMGAIDPDDPRHLTGADRLAGLPDWRAMVMEDLRGAAGGADALDALDVRPLPDEPMALDAVPEDVRMRVEEVAALADGACDALFDVEMRTACRRLLARVAADGPGFFRGPGRAETAAAGLVWAVARVNGHFRGGPPLARELAAHLGVGQGGMSQRAQRMLDAAGIARGGSFEMTLGMPGLLVSARRAELVERRDRLRADAEG